jgi:hypothetical protein
MSRYLKLAVIVTLLALVAASCGDSGSADDVGTAATASSDDGGSDTESTDSDSASDDTFPVTVAGIPGIDDDCEALVNVFLSLSTIFAGGDFGGINRDAFNDLPGDLKDDVGLVIDTFESYAEALEDMGVDLSDPQSLASLSEAQQQELGELSESFDTEAFNTAADNLQTFGEEECTTFFTPGG